ncbi:MAG TPA: SRPBCC domain-containing protein [Alphaproteobacteria bacterium]|nr:SRPBCC domain-containing protein [Alphaproteobacteria bacterium]
MIERVFHAPVAAVWKAITDRDQMIQWFFPQIESFKPEVGFQTQFNVHYEGKDSLHIWKITEVVVSKKIVYSWKYGGHPGDSSLTFELFAEGGNTRLRLTHTGLETFIPKKNPHLARKNFLQGWTNFSNALASFLGKTGAAKG